MPSSVELRLSRGSSSPTARGHSARRPRTPRTFDRRSASQLLPSGARRSSGDGQTRRQRRPVHSRSSTDARKKRTSRRSPSSKRRYATSSSLGGSDEGWGAPVIPRRNRLCEQTTPTQPILQASPGEAEGPTKGPEEDCADVEAAGEKSQTSAEARLSRRSRSLLQGASEAGAAKAQRSRRGRWRCRRNCRGPRKPLEAVGELLRSPEMQADEAVGSWLGPKSASQRLRSEGRQRRVFRRGRPSRRRGSAGASHAPGALDVSESEAQQERARQSWKADRIGERPGPGESSTAQDVPAPESDLEPNVSCAPESTPTIRAVSQKAQLLRRASLIGESDAVGRWRRRLRQTRESRGRQGSGRELGGRILEFSRERR